jgi:hypothetical protein
VDTKYDAVIGSGLKVDCSQVLGRVQNNLYSNFAPSFFWLQVCLFCFVIFKELITQLSHKPLEGLVARGFAWLVSGFA